MCIRDIDTGGKSFLQTHLNLQNGPSGSSIAVRIVGTAKQPSTMLLLRQQNKFVSLRVQRQRGLDLLVLNFIVQKSLLQLLDLVQTFELLSLLFHQHVRFDHEQ